MSSDAPAPEQPPRSRPLAAAGLGLCAGLLLGGLMLLFFGLRGLLVLPDCSHVRKAECDLLTEAAQQVGRTQLLCGGALVALSLAVAVLLRPAPRSEEPGPRP
jgi:hypothetical protein